MTVVSDSTVKQNRAQPPPMKLQSKSNGKGGSTNSNSSSYGSTKTKTKTKTEAIAALESPPPPDRCLRLRFRRNNQTNKNKNKNNMFWAHFKQRWRRNLIAGAGPVLILVLAILLIRPTHNHFHRSATATSASSETATLHAESITEIFHVSSLPLLHYLPLVEAMPFFRRTPNNKNNRKPKTALGVAEAAQTQSQSQKQTTQENEEGTTTNNINERSGRNNKNKRKKSSSSYNFPLIDNWEECLANSNNNSNESTNTIPIPFRYLDAYQQKEGPARKAVVKTLEWRREWNIDTILERPHPNYDIAKRILPHYFIGHSAKTKHVVFIQRPGFSNLKLAKHNGISLDDMLYQYAWVFEYCWNILHDRDDPNALMISIIDLQGINLSILRKPELLNFVKTFVAMIDAHYPTRAYKTYMINAPQWFSTLYKVIKPVMRETTKEKIVLYSAGSAQNKALEEALGNDMAKLVQQALQIPGKNNKSNDGGDSDSDDSGDGNNNKGKNKDKDPSDLTLTSDILLETPMEQEMRNFVLEQLDGQSMKPIIAPKKTS